MRSPHAFKHSNDSRGFSIRSEALAYPASYTIKNRPTRRSFRGASPLRMSQDAGTASPEVRQSDGLGSLTVNSSSQPIASIVEVTGSILVRSTN
jgi:hypothetical protein